MSYLTVGDIIFEDMKLDIEKEISAIDTAVEKLY